MFGKIREFFKNVSGFGRLLYEIFTIFQNKGVFQPGIHSLSPDSVSSLKYRIGTDDSMFVKSVDMFK